MSSRFGNLSPFNKQRFQRATGIFLSVAHRAVHPLSNFNNTARLADGETSLGVTFLPPTRYASYPPAGHGTTALPLLERDRPFTAQVTVPLTFRTGSTLSAAIIGTVTLVTATASGAAGSDCRVVLLVPWQAPAPSGGKPTGHPLSNVEFSSPRTRLPCTPVTGGTVLTLLFDGLPLPPAACSYRGSAVRLEFLLRLSLCRPSGPPVILSLPLLLLPPSRSTVPSPIQGANPPIEATSPRCLLSAAESGASARAGGLACGDDQVTTLCGMGAFCAVRFTATKAAGIDDIINGSVEVVTLARGCISLSGIDVALVLEESVAGATLSTQEFGIREVLDGSPVNYQSATCDIPFKIPFKFPLSVLFNMPAQNSVCPLTQASVNVSKQAPLPKTRSSNQPLPASGNPSDPTSKRADQSLQSSQASIRFGTVFNGTAPIPPSHCKLSSPHPPVQVKYHLVCILRLAKPVEVPAVDRLGKGGAAAQVSPDIRNLMIKLPFELLVDDVPKYISAAPDSASGNDQADSEDGEDEVTSSESTLQAMVPLVVEEEPEALQDSRPGSPTARDESLRPWCALDPGWDFLARRSDVVRAQSQRQQSVASASSLASPFVLRRIDEAYPGPAPRYNFLPRQPVKSIHQNIFIDSDTDSVDGDDAHRPPPTSQLPTTCSSVLTGSSAKLPWHPLAD